MADIHPGKVLPYRSPQRRQERTSRLGMVMFLASWAMMFAALFFVYGGVRLRAPVWPPVQYPEIPLGLPTLNTVIVAVSSATLVWAIASVSGGAQHRAAWALLLTTVLGAGFLALQLVVWGQLNDAGLSPSSGTYGSAFFGLTWVHAAHVLVGVGALLVLTVRCFFGAYTPARYLSVRLWAMYWHFVAAIWGVLFLTVYLL